MNRARRFMPLLFVLGTFVVIGLLAVGFVWSGIYDIGADNPHTVPVKKALQSLRERSIADARRRSSCPPAWMMASALPRGRAITPRCAPFVISRPAFCSQNCGTVSIHSRRRWLSRRARSPHHVLGHQARHQNERDACVGEVARRRHHLEYRRFYSTATEFVAVGYRAVAGEATLHDGHVHPGVGTGSQSDHDRLRLTGQGHARTARRNNIRTTIIAIEVVRGQDPLQSRHSERALRRDRNRTGEVVVRIGASVPAHRRCYAALNRRRTFLVARGTPTGAPSSVSASIWGI